MPAVFVLIWSTGFIVARYGMPYAPPMKFLAMRYALSVACFAVWAFAARAAWPADRRQFRHLAVTGVLMHAGYLGGVWAAVKLGMGAGLAALLVGLQPVLTAVWISVARRRGVARANGPGWCWASAGWRWWSGTSWAWAKSTRANFALALGALLSITAGTLYQKRFVAPCDVRTANLVQLCAALVVTLPLALLETEAMHWNGQLIGAMAWSVLALTLGGSSLLYLLIQRGAATAVTSLLYLVPPCTALMAWLLFGEPIAVLDRRGHGAHRAGREPGGASRGRAGP